MTTSKSKPQPQGSVVGLPHHRRPLRQSRKLLKWSLIFGGIATLVVLVIVWQLVSR